MYTYIYSLDSCRFPFMLFGRMFGKCNLKYIVDKDGGSKGFASGKDWENIYKGKIRFTSVEIKLKDSNFCKSLSRFCKFRFEN